MSRQRCFGPVKQGLHGKMCSPVECSTEVPRLLTHPRGCPAAALQTQVYRLLFSLLQKESCCFELACST